MTNNNTNQKYTLVTKDGEPVLMERTGEPFLYSTKALATQGKRSLENHRKVSLRVIPAA
jgi:hypothetical protein